MSALIEGVPPILARAASDLKDHGHALPDALALTVNTLRTIAAGTNGKPSYAQRNEAREIITEFSTGKSKLSAGLRKGVERIETSKKPLKPDEVHALVERAEHRLALHEGVLLAFDKASPGETLPSRLTEAAARLVGEGERDEMRDRLKQAAAADRSLAEMFRLVEAPPRTSVNTTRGENLKGTSEMTGPAVNPEFEQLHPRAQGKFAPKGGAEEASRPASSPGRSAESGAGTGPSPGEVNDLLGQLGFDSGDLAAYQSSVNLKPTGEIDAVTYEMMKRQVAIRNAGPKKGETVLSADQPSAESGATSTPPRPPRSTTKAKAKKHAAKPKVKKPARVVQAAERIEEADFTPSLHPRDRVGRFRKGQSVIGPLGVKSVVVGHGERKGFIKLRDAKGETFDAAESHISEPGEGTPPAKGVGAGKVKRTTAKSHLSEPVNYGGETVTRGEMIADLERVAKSQTDDPKQQKAIVDRYLQGHEAGAAARTKKRNLERYGKADAHGRGAGAGKDAGGPDDHEDPIAIERHQERKHAARDAGTEHDPRTPAGQKKGLSFFKTLDLKELRKRQDLTKQQIKTAYDQKNTDALERLQATEDLLTQAVHHIAFEKKNKGKHLRRGHDLLGEATVVNNAMVGGHVSGTATAWGGATTPLMVTGAWGEGEVTAEAGEPLVTELLGIRQQLSAVVEARKEAQTENDTRMFTRLRGRESALRERLADVEAAMRELQEVKSSAYPGLDRSKKENWVDKAGGLPSYIERIAKHLHYEQGMTISHAIASAVNTVKKWCAGATVSSTGGVKGGGGVKADTKAKACAAVAQWEAKKGKAKVSEAVDELVEAARAEGAWYYPTLEECAEILAGTETMTDEYPPIREALVTLAKRTSGGVGDVVNWDPKKHPRNRLGKFTDVLDKLMHGEDHHEHAHVERHREPLPRAARAGAGGGKVRRAVDTGGGAGLSPHGPRRFMSDEKRRELGMGAGKERQLTTPEKNQLRVAKHTLKIHPSMRGVMGGPTRDEAINIIEKLTGERPTDPHAKMGAGKEWSPREIADAKNAIKRDVMGRFGGDLMGPALKSVEVSDEDARRYLNGASVDELLPGRGAGSGKDFWDDVPPGMHRTVINLRTGDVQSTDPTLHRPVGVEGTTDLKSKPLYDLAAIIQRDWSKQGKGVNFGAKPYLEAMHSMSTHKEPYYADPGHQIVRYFLSNASSWRGETAKAVKAELKRRLKESVEGSEFVAKLDKLEEATAERMAAQTYGNTEAFVAAQARERALREQVMEATLTSKARENLPSSAFVFPARKGYPIHDKAHGANALARASGKSEYSTVKKAVCSRYPDLPACKGD